MKDRSGAVLRSALIDELVAVTSTSLVVQRTRGSVMLRSASGDRWCYVEFRLERSGTLIEISCCVALDPVVAKRLPGLDPARTTDAPSTFLTAWVKDPTVEAFGLGASMGWSSDNELGRWAAAFDQPSWPTVVSRVQSFGEAIRSLVALGPFVARPIEPQRDVFQLVGSLS